MILEYIFYELSLGVTMDGIFAIVRLAFVTTLLLFPFIFIGKFMVDDMIKRWNIPFWIASFISCFILSFVLWFMIIYIF